MAHSACLFMREIRAMGRFARTVPGRVRELAHDALGKALSAGADRMWGPGLPVVGDAAVDLRTYRILQP
jgi:hypothetical protein